MAPADAGNFILDEDDDDFFGEYNPHPYRGGYDIAATFGTPLPPSANICYPVSSSAATAVLAPPSPPSPTKAPADPPPKEPYDDKEAPREPVYESPEVFPKEAAARKGKGRRGGRWRRRFWKKCVRGLDYLFGYKDPYREQRIVVDSYVVPVYANTKERGKDSLPVEDDMAPLEVGIVEAHDANEELYRSNDLPWHTKDRDETNTYSQPVSNSYYIPFAQSYGLPGVLGKSDWFLNFSSSGSRQLEEFQHELSLSYDVEHNISGEPIHCYHHHCYKPTLDVQVEPLETVSSQSMFQHIVTKVIATSWKLQQMHTTFNPIHRSMMCHWNHLSHHGLRIGAFMMHRGMLLKTIQILKCLVNMEALQACSFPLSILERQKLLSCPLAMSMLHFSIIGII
ncbi:hypothetical protein BS78_01G366500 [Paspalum vaginatum]|nr:hypothetical protein BS78_01G366500 [Paspalum vaginatum]